MGVTQRDAFFGEIIKAAMDDKDIVILSADSGAPAFNKIRKERPHQWIHCGIAEANMISVAAGLSLAGKKVYCFAIIPFITGRCFDQIKVAIALQGLPVTLVGVGAGFSYDDGGPTHYGVEDIGIMKNLKGIEILSPRSEATAAFAARDSLNIPRFRYIRLDRHVLPEMGAFINPDEKISVITYGAMSDQAIKVAEFYQPIQVHPFATIHPFGGMNVIVGERIIVIEEHFYTGGLGESVAAWMKDHDDHRPLLRCAIPDHYEWENGGRAHLWKRAGLDVKSLTKRISEWLERY